MLPKIAQELPDTVKKQAKKGGVSLTGRKKAIKKSSMGRASPGETYSPVGLRSSRLIDSEERKKKCPAQERRSARRWLCREKKNNLKLSGGTP